MAHLQPALVSPLWADRGRTPLALGLDTWTTSESLAAFPVSACRPCWRRTWRRLIPIPLKRAVPLPSPCAPLRILADLVRRVHALRSSRPAACSLRTPQQTARSHNPGGG